MYATIIDDITGKGRVAATNAQEWIEEFIFYEEFEKGHSPNTTAAYRREALALTAYLDGAGGALGQLTRDDIESYVAYLFEQGLIARSVAHYITVARMYCRFLAGEGYIRRNPFEAIRNPKFRPRLPRGLSEDECARLMAGPTNETPYGVRNRALLELIYGCGLRISEATSLTLGDVRTERPMIRVKGKGQKERLVPLGSYARKAVLEYLTQARTLLDPKCDRLFVNRHGGPLSRQNATKFVTKYAMSVGITRRVSAHTLRHAFATHLLDHDAPLLDISEMLGHSSILTTEIYTHVSMSRLREVYERSHPHGSMVSIKRELGGGHKNA